MRTHTKTFHIRFTETEYERLCKYSKKAGLPKSTYIRHMINGCCPREHQKVTSTISTDRRIGAEHCSTNCAGRCISLEVCTQTTLLR